jgi:hypothetical protein
MPEPMTPAECDLRGLSFMPLDVVRLLDSDLFALSTGDEFKAAVALWAKAWTQVPAASLPDDDRILAHLSGTGRAWKKIKNMALRGFVLCSDGRWYHPVIAEKAKEAWAHRLKQREKAAKRWDREKPERGNAVADAAAYPPAMQGTGRGTVVPLSNDNGGSAVSEPDPEKDFWANAKVYLAPHSRNPGALVGKWLRDNGKTETARAITAAQIEHAVEPVAYIEGYFRRQSGGGEGVLSVPC